MVLFELATFSLTEGFTLTPFNKITLEEINLAGRGTYRGSLHSQKSV